MSILNNYFTLGKPGNPGVACHWPEFLTQLSDAAAPDFRRLYPMADGWWDLDDAGINRRMREEQEAVVVTADALVTPIYTSPAITGLTPEILVLEATIMCVDPANDANYGSYQRRATYTWDGGAILTLRCSVSVGNDCEFNAGMNVTFDALGTSARMLVTGVAATTLNWYALFRFVKGNGNLV